MSSLFRQLLLITLCHLALPLLMNSQPLIVHHQHQIYFPSVISYLESDLGGQHPIIADFSDPDTNSLLDDAWILSPLYPHSLAPDFKEPHPSQPPSMAHWLGTNHLGQDILVYALYALIYSLTLPIVLTTLSAQIGGIMGVISATLGGGVDLAYLWSYEVCRSIPFTLILMLSLPHSVFMFIALFSFTQWTKFAHLSRNEALQLLEKPYIQDALFSGMSKPSLIKNHLMPAIKKFWHNQLSHTFLNYFVLQQSLCYFGLNLFPQSPSLGNLLLQVKQHPEGIWMLLPILLCFMAVTAASYWLFPADRHCDQTCTKN